MRNERHISGFCLIAWAALWAIGCAGSQVKVQQGMPVEQYNDLSWQDKIVYLESLKTGKKPGPGIDFYSNAFRDDVSSVVIAAIDSITPVQSRDFKSILYPLLKRKNPVLRWKACKKIGERPVDADLSYMAFAFTDKDWMVRECSFSQMRLYPYERSDKTYFFSVISSLNERNPQVLKEIYQTLKWYDDDRAFPFMFKRLFHAATASELIIIMRELAVYNDPQVKQRIWYYSNYHTDFFVREEAARLLSAM